MPSTTHLRAFHQAAWNEPLLHEQTSPGERGLDVPATEPGIAAAVGDGLSAIPPALRRREPPALPELSQPAVLRHFLRLSQETFGQDIDIHLGLGTCTMKYSPKVNEALVRSHKVTHMHPWQDERHGAGDPRGDLPPGADHLRDLRHGPRVVPARRRHRRRCTRTPA